MDAKRLIKPPIARIIIDWDGENISIAGPVHDKILMLGLLELVRITVGNARQALPPQMPAGKPDLKVN